MRSLSARRAWIEIGLFGVDTVSRQVALRKESVDRNHQVCQFTCARRLSLSARRAWIEITVVGVLATLVTASLSARRAWIEIPAGCWRDARRAVALRKESVDRNKYVVQCRKTLGVALRKESVDRNKYVVQCLKTLGVALRKESVDRNCR